MYVYKPENKYALNARVPKASENQVCLDMWRGLEIKKTYAWKFKTKKVRKTRMLKMPENKCAWMFGKNTEPKTFMLRNPKRIC